MKVRTDSGARSVTSGVDPPNSSGASGFRMIAVAAPVVVGIGLTIAVLWGVSTAQSRISASTRTNSLMSAGRIDLIVEDGTERAVERLLFDETGLYGGAVRERCLVVRYEGTFDSASIRLHGNEGLNTGLARYVDTTVHRGTGEDPGCGDFTPTSTMFTGSLDEMLTRHSSFGRGIAVADPASVGEPTAVRVRLEVADDNDAQGRTTAFMLLFEVRP